MNGYTHAAYAAALAEFGSPRLLPGSGGWILERPIPLTPYRDAMGCYPLFACDDWSRLRADLETLRDELVSLAIVADPFGAHDPAYLRACFPDLVVPFKAHMVTDLSRSPESFVDAHHRRNTRVSLERLTVERCADATVVADEWSGLYATLLARHGIRGLAAFSAASFKAQLAVPGMTVFRAAHEDETVGMTLWYADRGVGYYHLGAYSETGYRLRASFALFWRVIEYFAAQGLKWLNLGAGAGLSDNPQEDGLARFKRGWATGTRQAYFCGRIFDPQRYAEALRAAHAADSGYFPAYRKAEFG
jgi:hypothetical protein